MERESIVKKHRADKRECTKVEQAAFAKSLRRHGQLHEGEGALPSGATHALEKPAKGKGAAALVRKRFSAI